MFLLDNDFIHRVDVHGLKLSITKSSRLDAIFIRKHGGDIFLTLYESLELPSNTVENIEAAYTTIALICVELVCEESVCDLLRLIMSIQVFVMLNTSYF